MTSRTYWWLWRAGLLAISAVGGVDTSFAAGTQVRIELKSPPAGRPPLLVQFDGGGGFGDGGFDSGGGGAEGGGGPGTDGAEINPDPPLLKPPLPPVLALHDVQACLAEGIG
jgi:hypothetical protein